MPAVPTPEPTAGDTRWFVHDRFGMFIHWGLYAMAARHEWVRNYEEMTHADYQKYFDGFNPAHYDPRLWARLARRAGMKYFVITAKHHEGFCLWDSKFTDYKSTNTPAGRDLLRPMVAAFREEGLKVGLYYSLIDWHHPDFTIDPLHPQRNHPEAAEMNASHDMRRYTEYLHNQVRELLTEFAPVDIVWFDYSYPEQTHRGLTGKGNDDWQSEKLVKMIRQIQPDIIINNRLDLPPRMADVHTPEQFQPPSWVHVNGEPVVWEANHTFSGSWGYHRDEATWKSPEQLIQLLVNTVSRGGNLLMNVGPTALGTFDARAIAALEVYAEWMAVHSHAVYGCSQSELDPPQDCRMTQNGDSVYLHIFAWPFRYLYVPGMADRLRYARFLHDGSEVQFKRSRDLRIHYGLKESLPPDSVILELPVKKPDTVVPVIELLLKE
jgi:alpha-L-fucosidase